MRRARSTLFLILLLTAAAPTAFGQPSSPTASAFSAADATALAAIIDERIAERCRTVGVDLAPAADDAEFMRRVHLDLIGRIPKVAEVRDFLDDPAPDKRERLIAELLDSPAYARHFSHVWRDVMLPELATNPDLAGLAPSFEAWLAARFKENVPYDRMVREIVVAPANGAAYERQFLADSGELPPSADTPFAFYGAKQNKPENVATATARVFLGVSLECAQCHDHPFSDWKREQFWSLAAFFADLENDGARPELPIPETGTTVKAAYLDGTAFNAKAGDPPRRALATWLTSAENPYFAKATVNRLWAHCFGIGLVQPVDDLDKNNPPSHPELLDQLAREFADHDFDLRFLLTAFVNTQAYQRTSRRTNAGQDDPTHFARMSLRALSAEQFYASFTQATGMGQSASGAQDGLANARRQEFMTIFQNPIADATQGQSSILQALTLMNGGLAADATSLTKSATLTAVSEAPFLNPSERIEALFLATLSRPATDEELAQLMTYVEWGGPAENEKAALADVFWSLLNSAEFRLNH